MKVTFVVSENDAEPRTAFLATSRSVMSPSVSITYLDSSIT